jgi:hypothetical protein
MEDHQRLNMLDLRSTNAYPSPITDRDTEAWAIPRVCGVRMAVSGG